MGGKSDPPPPPDYSGIAAAQMQSAEYSYQLGRDQLAWAKDQYAQNKEISSRVIDNALARMNDEDINARGDRDRYEIMFQPREVQLIQDADQFNYGQRGEQMAGRAMVDVSREFEKARVAAQDQLESYGIDPSQVRSGSLDVNSRVQEAAARAGAATQGRERAENMGRALRSEVINIGRGYPGQIAQTYGTAMQSGNQGANTGLATTASGVQSMGTPMQYQQLGDTSLKNTGDLMTGMYNAQVRGYEASQKNSSSGVGQALGLVGGLLGAFMEEGGPVPESDGGGHQAVLPAAHGGVPVERGMSPSQGVIPDDVPARLNAGEFVLPKDVVAWKGQEFLQKLIAKSREDKEGAPAKPRRGVIPAQQPVLNTAGVV